jgi:hypothetical protein
MLKGFGMPPPSGSNLASFLTTSNHSKFFV